MSVPRSRNVGLFAYSIHARARGIVVDYQGLFTALADASSLDRQTSVGDETVAITVMSESDESRWTLRFVAGREGLPPLFYDPVTGTESTADLGTSFVASSAWLFVDLDSRFAVTTKSRPGVAVGVMAQCLSHLGRELGAQPDLVVDLNPVPTEDFISELERFERVRQASVVLSRPNYDWTDNADQLSGYADESGAGTVELGMNAPRGQSLSTRQGIISDIKRLVAKPIGPLKNVRITGRRTGDSRETTVSLERHQEKRYVAIPDGQSALATRDELQTSAIDLLNGLAERLVTDPDSSE